MFPSGLGGGGLGTVVSGGRPVVVRYELFIGGTTPQEQLSVAHHPYWTLTPRPAPSASAQRPQPPRPPGRGGPEKRTRRWAACLGGRVGQSWPSPPRKAGVSVGSGGRRSGDRRFWRSTCRRAVRVVYGRHDTAGAGVSGTSIYMHVDADRRAGCLRGPATRWSGAQACCPKRRVARRTCVHGTQRAYRLGWVATSCRGLSVDPRPVGCGHVAIATADRGHRGPHRSAHLGGRDLR